MLLALLVACATDPVDTGPVAGPGADAPTWHRDAGPIVQARCAGCHQPGDIAPFPLTDFDEAYAGRTALRAVVNAGIMPPWPPSDDCTSYAGDRSLTDAERDTLLAWVDGGAPEGDPADAPAPAPSPVALLPDAILDAPEAYTPRQQPDDYRCQLLAWTPEATTFVTGLEVLPDRRDMVHHVLVFLIPEGSVAGYEALDASEAGPGWTCFGGPGGNSTEARIRTVGSWVPGKVDHLFPAGTGMALHPGDRMIMQVHYNTSTAEPGPDQTALALQLDDAVDRVATQALLTDIGWVLGLDMFGGDMRIGAGESNVTHTTEISASGLFFQQVRSDLGLAARDPMLIHAVSHHMHLLGTAGHIGVRRPDDSEACLLDIPAWDFDWQGGYKLAEPLLMNPDDVITLSCTWDNRDGAEDVYWGEGTTDEMCLGGVYVTAAD